MKKISRSIIKLGRQRFLFILKEQAGIIDMLPREFHIWITAPDALVVCIVLAEWQTQVFIRIVMPIRQVKLFTCLFIN